MYVEVFFSIKFLGYLFPCPSFMKVFYLLQCMILPVQRWITDPTTSVITEKYSIDRIIPNQTVNSLKN